MTSLNAGVEEEIEEDNESETDDTGNGTTPLLRSSQVNPADTPPNQRAKSYETGDVTETGVIAETGVVTEGSDNPMSVNGDGPVMYSNGAENVDINSSQNNAALNDWRRADVTRDTVRMPEVRISPEDDSSLKYRRFWALCKVYWLFLRRNSELIVFRIVIPVIMILVGAAVFAFVPLSTNDETNDDVMLDLTASLYARVGSQSRDEPNMTYAYGVEPEADELRFMQQMRQDDIYLTLTDDSYDFLASDDHFHLGVTVYNASFTAAAADEDSTSNFTARYNDSAVHSLPIVQNLITNTILGVLGSSANVTTYMQRFPNLEFDYSGFSGAVFGATFILGMALAFPPATFAMFIVGEREVHVQEVVVFGS